MGTDQLIGLRVCILTCSVHRGREGFINTSGGGGIRYIGGMFNTSGGGGVRYIGGMFNTSGGGGVQYIGGIL